MGSLSSILRANVTKSSFHTTRKCITHMDQYGKIHGDIFDFIQQGNKVMIIDHPLPKREDVHNFVFFCCYCGVDVCIAES